MLEVIKKFLGNLKREAEIPPPPFKASKRTARIMNGLWYGRLSKQEARRKAAEWRFSPEAIEDMLSQATQPPSYWSRTPDHEA